MGIDFVSERNYSWKRLSLRKKTTDERNGSFIEIKNYCFWKKKRFKIVWMNLKKLNEKIVEKIGKKPQSVFSERTIFRNKLFEKTIIFYWTNIFFEQIFKKWAIVLRTNAINFIFERWVVNEQWTNEMKKVVHAHL